jgi:hypothetical protein
MCTVDPAPKGDGDPEVTQPMIDAAKRVLAAHCWDDGVLSFKIGIDQAVGAALRAAIEARPGACEEA